MEEKKNRKIIWIISTMAVVVILLVVFAFFISRQNSDETTRQINLGDMVILNEKDKELLRNKTIKYVKDNLKSPITAQFEEEFKYECIEANIIRVSGYVDSQNSFGAMLRGSFICEYFAIDNDISTLVYLKYDDAELLNIKESYIEEYISRKQLNDIKKSGNELNKEKLDYIMDEFNNDETNGVAKIVKTSFNDSESIIEAEITARTEMSDNYWINFSICSIMDYINEFDIIGTVKIILVDSNNKVEVFFNDEFVKNKWKDNNRIDLVQEIFGENYKII